MDLASERGMARLTTTTRVAIVVVIMSVIAFDVSAVVVNIFQLDALGHRAAQSAAAAYRRSPRAAAVQAAVEAEVAGDGDVDIDRIALDRATVSVTLRRPPAVLVVDRIPPVKRRIDLSITQHATLDPSGL